jgi:two-component system invasion response regulator UvrY
VSLRERSPVTVLCADDHPQCRSVLREVIAASPGFSQIGEAACGRDAIAAVATLRPDLLLMDVRMPGVDGIEAARILGARHQDLVVVLMSADYTPPPSGYAAAGTRVIFVRKQDLCPGLLADMWHGRRTRCGPNWVVVRLSDECPRG